MYWPINVDLPHLLTPVITFTKLVSSRNDSNSEMYLLLLTSWTVIYGHIEL